MNTITDSVNTINTPFIHSSPRGGVGASRRMTAPAMVHHESYRTGSRALWCVIGLLDAPGQVAAGHEVRD
jgi:hypothetical protein